MPAFKGAPLSTILDSNITTFIARRRAVLYRHRPRCAVFAVTLGIGIITTVFTAFTLTRLIVAWWGAVETAAKRADLGSFAGCDTFRSDLPWHPDCRG